MSVVSSRLTALALVLPLCFGAGSLIAHEYTHGNLKIGHPWTRATPSGATVAGGFMTIANQGQQTDRLVSATSSAAGRMEIHEMRMDGEIMRMRELPNGLPIDSGKTVALAPGGYHIMLMELKQPLQKGSKIPVTLTFEKAGAVTVDLLVEAMDARESGHHQPEHHHPPKKP